MPSFSATKDYYAVLEIASSASQAEIKKAWRRLSLLHHPDKNRRSVEEAKVRFQHLTEANDVLSEPSLHSQWRAARACFLSAQRLPGKASSKVSKPAAAAAAKKEKSKPFSFAGRGKEWKEDARPFSTKPAPKPAASKPFPFSSYSSTTNSSGFFSSGYKPFASFARPSPTATAFSNTSQPQPPPPKPSFSSAFKAPTPPSSTNTNINTEPPSPTYTTAKTKQSAARATEAAADAEIAALEAKLAAAKAKKEAATKERGAAEAAMKESEVRRKMREAEKKGFAGGSRKEEARKGEKEKKG